VRLSPFRFFVSNLIIRSGGTTLKQGARELCVFFGMEAELNAVIEESLRLYIFPNAIFYAERLYSLFPSLASILALARCYMASGDPGTCVRLLNMTSLDALSNGSLDCAKTLDAQRRQCWYLLGVACVQCERFTDAETALLNTIPSEDGAAEYWLGICGKRLTRSTAMSNFRTSFERSPALFVAYQELVGLQKPPETFAANGGPVFPNLYQDLLDRDADQREQQEQDVVSNGGDAAHTTAAAAQDPAALWGDEAVHANSRFSAPPPPRSIPVMGSMRKAGSMRTSSGSPPPVPANRGPGSPTKRATSSAWGMPLMSASRRPRPCAVTVGMVQFLACYAHVAALTAAFQCRDAIQRLKTDTLLERDALWQLPNIAMCCFHLGETAEARVYFDRMRHVCRWRLHDPSIVFYSTVLWHQRDEHALGYLTQLLVDQSPVHAVTLCVAGNCYSLAKDSKMAAQVLMRATTIDKTIPYAFTLLGYEILAADPNRAEAAFVDALKLDPRHYMALAGLGELAYRADDVHKAQQYFTAALSINRQPTVMNRLAATYHRRGASKEHLRAALDIYDACLQRTPANVGARHHRAEVLMRMRRFEDALFELERLRADCPEEAALFMSLGRCAHRLGRVAQANQYYHKVLDLDPRRSVATKACLERLQQGQPPDDDE
jgi:tetratricopeptide (TPR) repeat protein